ncbi:trimeric intracellular cation channel family protein [Anaerobium acetethylicum]|uniref:Uncharacterized membrane protein YeiH n=1 Tax=Anaerobium acetethylicum TaxID=1619234 RepID=A0A1D3TWY7_9FIRM|nr:trimeric intracellular cation channel family protein [Anaerobium acetethylicum]SCP98779.1 Uncharacterized membrane protein YeiH [Anaerobium acetethylicum]
MEFISVVEIIGTVAFAMSGALTAIQKELDYYGIIIFAFITAVGGGIVRDTLINRRLPASLDNPVYAVISILAALFVILFYKRIHHLSRVLPLFDAFGLGAFTAIGAEVAVKNGHSEPFVIITLAVLTGTGGGVLRDICAQEIPYVFRKEIYAVASVFGAVLFIILNETIGNDAALYGCFAITLLIRIFCMRKNIHLKKVENR